MNITTRTGLVGFFLALSALSIPTATAASNQPSSPQATDTPQTIENRLTRLTDAIRQRETQLPEELVAPTDFRVALGWADGRGRDWVNTRAGGWGDGGRGSFVNRNGWRNGGGFYNYRY